MGRGLDLFGGMQMTIKSYKFHRKGTWKGAADHLLLTYDERFLRRRVLTTAHGAKLLVDLAQTASLNHGDAFEVDTGEMIEVQAKPEGLLAITGDDLVRLAWHIGNRHTPCQIETTRLLIQRDKVLRDMLGQLGAHVAEVTEPFTPEGGAYGHGRTHGHSHGDHSHDHGDHNHSHDHDHSRDHDHTQAQAHSHDHG